MKLRLRDGDRDLARDFDDHVGVLCRVRTHMGRRHGERATTFPGERAAMMARSMRWRFSSRSVNPRELIPRRQFAGPHMDQPHREHGERGDGAHEHDDLVATCDEVEPDHDERQQRVDEPGQAVLPVKDRR